MESATLDLPSTERSGGYSSDEDQIGLPGLDDPAGTSAPLAQTKAVELAAERPEGDDDVWRWDRHNSSIVLFDQPETAVYQNPRGGIVIRQEARWDQDEDPYVYFNSPAAALTIAEAVYKELGLPVPPRKGGR